MLNRGARAKAEGSRLIAAARSEKRACLLEPEAKVLRALRDEPVPAEGVVPSADQAVALAGGFSAKAVLKIASPDHQPRKGAAPRGCPHHSQRAALSAGHESPKPAPGGRKKPTRRESAITAPFFGAIAAQAA